MTSQYQKEFDDAVETTCTPRINHLINPIDYHLLSPELQEKSLDKPIINDSMRLQVEMNTLAG